MGIGVTGIASVPQGFARIEIGPESLLFSPGQIVNGRIAQLGPKGAVVEIAGRLGTMMTDLDLAVGEQVQLSVNEAGKEQVLLQLVGREGVLLAAQPSAEQELARLVASNRLPVDVPHLNAARRLLARGLPITRKGLELAAGAERQSLHAGPRLESTDSVLSRLLGDLDLTADRPHLYAARQLLARGLPVNRENVDQLTRILARFEATTEADFQAAAYLRANGLPLTRSTVALIRSFLQNPAPVGEQLHQLQQTLAWVSELLDALGVEKDFPRGEFQRLVKGVAEQLSQRVVRAEGEDRTVLAEGLRRVFEDQGTSLENRLARLLSGELEPTELERDLRMLLARLAEAAPGGRRGPGGTSDGPPGNSPGPTVQKDGDGEPWRMTAGTADPPEGASPPAASDAGRSKAETASRRGTPGAVNAGESLPAEQGKLKGAATSLALPPQVAHPRGDEKMALPENPELRYALAHLGRVGPELAGALQLQQLKNSAQPRDPSEQWLSFVVPLAGIGGGPPRTVELRVSRGAGGAVDPGRVRLRLRVELPRLETVEVRLDLLGKQINCHLASSGGDTLPALREQFSSLREGLERLGYIVGALGFGMLTAESDPTVVAVEVPEHLVRIDMRA